MNLAARRYDPARFLDTPEMIYCYLAESLGANEPRYVAKALSAVSRARGGMENLSAETGVSVAALERSCENEHEVDRETVTKVLAAFRPQFEDSQPKVA